MKKAVRIIALFMALLTGLSALGMVTFVSSAETTTESTKFSGGDGSAEDPYKISTPEDLTEFAEMSGNFTPDMHFVLTNDIAYTDYKQGDKNFTGTQWIGPKSFAGVFDGGGYTISGLYFSNKEYTCNGFIASTNKTYSDLVTIKNINIVNSYFEAKAQVASILGKVDGDGICDVTISGCSSSATVKARGTSYTGGIFGICNNVKIALTIENCIFMGNISSGSCVGGIAGQIGTSTIANIRKQSYVKNCLNLGTITGTRLVAGIVGRDYYGCTVSDCVNIGKITATSTDEDDTRKKQYGSVVSFESSQNGTNGDYYDADHPNYYLLSNAAVQTKWGDTVPSATDKYQSAVETFTTATCPTLSSDYWVFAADGSGVMLKSFAPAFSEVNVSLGENINVNYYNDYIYADPKTTFTMNGKSVTVDGKLTDDGKQYKFTFEGVAPQCLGDKITAVLKDGDTVIGSKEYSVVEYLTKLKADNASDAKLMALVNDLLVYGGAAQAYKGQTNTLGNGVTGSTYEAPVAAAYKLNDSKITWKTATVLFDSVNKIKITFEADDITGITFTCNDAEITPVSNGDGTYTVITDAISAVELDKVFRIMTSSEDPEAANISYSVATYVLAKDDGDTAMANLVKALYNYGCSAKAYADAQ